jgi:hypothetical protein
MDEDDGLLNVIISNNNSNDLIINKTKENTIRCSSSKYISNKDRLLYDLDNIEKYLPPKRSSSASSSRLINPINKSTNVSKIVDSINSANNNASSSAVHSKNIRVRNLSGSNSIQHSSLILDLPKNRHSFVSMTAATLNSNNNQQNNKATSLTHHHNHHVRTLSSSSSLSTSSSLSSNSFLLSTLPPNGFTHHNHHHNIPINSNLKPAAVKTHNPSTSTTKNNNNVMMESSSINLQNYSIADDSSVFIEEDIHQIGGVVGISGGCELPSANHHVIMMSSNHSSISNSTTNNFDDCCYYENENLLIGSSSAVSGSNGGIGGSSSLFYDLNSRSSTSSNSNRGSTSNLCNLSKLKIQQEENEFQNLINKCQAWIEV